MFNKKIFKVSFAPLISILIGFSQINAMDQSYLQSTNDLEVEKWLIKSILAGERVDLTDRKIRAVVLQKLLTYSFPDKEEYKEGTKIIGKEEFIRKGITIKNAIIKGILNISESEIPFRVELINCKFEDGVSFENSHFKKTINLNNCSFKFISLRSIKAEEDISIINSEFIGISDFSYMSVKGVFDIRKSTFNKNISFFKATIDNNCILTECKFLAEDGIAIFHGMKVKGTIFLEKTIFHGEIDFKFAEISINFQADSSQLNTIKKPLMFSNMKVGKYMHLNYAKFKNPVSFSNIEIGGDVIAESTIFEKTVNFSHAKISGNLNFKFCNFKKDAIFEFITVGNFIDLFNSKCSGKINFKNAVIKKNFSATDARFKKADFLGINIEGNLLLDKTIFEGFVNFYNANIIGNLEITSAKFHYQSSLAANFMKMKIGQNANFHNTIFHGGIFFNQTDILGDFRAPGSQFLNSKENVEFSLMNIGGIVVLTQSKFKGQTIFFNTVINGSFWADKMKFFNSNLQTNFSTMFIGNHLFMEKSQFNGPVKFTEATITGNLQAQNSYFSNPDSLIKFDGIYIGGDALFDNTIFMGPVSICEAEIQAVFQAKNAKFENISNKKCLIFNNSTVNSFASFKQAYFAGEVSMTDSKFLDLSICGTKSSSNNLQLLNLSRTTISRQLEIKDINIKNINANSLNIIGPCIYSNVTFSEKADFQFCKFIDITFSNINWPVKIDSFILDGISFENINYKHTSMESSSLNKKEKNLKTTVTKNEDLLIQLADSAKFSANLYQKLEEFLWRTGKPEHADKLFINRKQRERSFNNIISIGWWSNLILEILVGYGRKPQQAFYWSAFFILVGWLVFFKKEGMEFRENNSNIKKYNSLWYSIDLFLPFINLHVAENWAPKSDRKFAYNYMKIHSICGWILIPIGFAALTGIIK